MRFRVYNAFMVPDPYRRRTPLLYIKTAHSYEPQSPHHVVEWSPSYDPRQGQCTLLLNFLCCLELFVPLLLIVNDLIAI